MPSPGADRSMTLQPAERRWRVYFNNHVIADSNDALLLREGDRPPVVYFPREEVAMEYMGRTDHTSHCPLKGDAAYYTLRISGEILENVAWSYEDPKPDAVRIASRIAFYPDRVEVYPVDDAEVNPRHRDDAEPRTVAADRAEVDAIVQHTDSGGGTSQGERWAPNVESPEAPDGGLR
jgi:uncharacterized protein (DUF427 family)